MTKNLALRLSAVALLAIPFGTARASLILSTQILQNGQGFGAVETIFTLQVTGGNQTLGTQIEQGCFAFPNTKGAFNPAENPGNMCTENAGNQVANGSPKNALPSLGDINITTAAQITSGQIGLLFNMNQVSTAGLTITGMNLSFYTAAGVSIFNAILPTVGWCNIAALCSGGETFLNSIPGQGGNGQLFVLDAAQRAALITAIGANPVSSILVGAGGIMGCAGTQTANCKEANDGAESFQLANTGIVVTPEPSTAALMATGLLGMVGVVRRRRRQG
jgi:hypothetical protein